MIGVWRGWLSGIFSHQMLAETPPVQAGGLNSALVQVAANDNHHKWRCSVNWLWYELKQNARTTITCHLYKGHATCTRDAPHSCCCIPCICVGRPCMGSLVVWLQERSLGGWIEALWGFKQCMWYINTIIDEGRTSNNWCRCSPLTSC